MADGGAAGATEVDPRAGGSTVPARVAPLRSRALRLAAPAQRMPAQRMLALPAASRLPVRRRSRAASPVPPAPPRAASRATPSGRERPRPARRWPLPPRRSPSAGTPAGTRRCGEAFGGRAPCAPLVRDVSRWHGGPSSGRRGRVPPRCRQLSPAGGGARVLGRQLPARRAHPWRPGAEPRGAHRLGPRVEGQVRGFRRPRPAAPVGSLRRRSGHQRGRFRRASSAGVPGVAGAGAPPRRSTRRAPPWRFVPATVRWVAASAARELRAGRRARGPCWRRRPRAPMPVPAWAPAAPLQLADERRPASRRRGRGPAVEALQVRSGPPGRFPARQRGSAASPIPATAPVPRRPRPRHRPPPPPA